MGSHVLQAASWREQGPGKEERSRIITLESLVR
jgi:hypothetical protein